MLLCNKHNLSATRALREVRDALQPLTFRQHAFNEGVELVSVGV
jgi:hypothetical protein